MKKIISYVFPIYNEEGNIKNLYETITNVTKPLENNYEFEFICINDGSKDDSLKMLIEIHKKDNRWKIINFSRNFGHQIAITAGIDFAKGDAVIIMDSDLQDPPSVSLELIKKWEEGYEVVYAQRRSRKDTFFKKLTAHIFYRVLDKLADINIPKDTGDFRLMDKKVANILREFREKNRFMRGLTVLVGFKQTAVLFDRDERKWGKTNYSLKKMIKLATDAITSFSNTPLKFITQLGSIILILSIVFLFFRIIISIFTNGKVIEIGEIMLFSIFFVGGIQLISLGIVGMYIGRIYSEVQKRPLYIISSIHE